MGTITLDTVTFDITPDDTPENPRRWDNLGRMACWHRSYVLGDRHDYRDPQAFAAEVSARTAVILPLYLFDHSGLTISTDPARFRACDPQGWDWGQVGYVYATKAAVRKEFGARRMSPRIRRAVEDRLRAEVAVYGQYLSGDVYGFEITDRATGAVIDACWGFFGDNPWTNGMSDYLPERYRDAILSYFHRDAA